MAFHANLADCCAKPGGCPRCCMVTACPCVAMGLLTHHVPRSANTAPCAGKCCGTCCLSFILSGGALGGFVVAPLFGYPLRRAAAPASYAWNPCKEFCTVMCCSCCALAQELNEVDRRGHQHLLREFGTRLLAPPDIRM